MLVDLLGSAENINIRLEKTQLKIESTITLTQIKTVKIHNRSDKMVRYAWKQYASQAEEDHIRASKDMITASLDAGIKETEASKKFLVFYLLI